MACLRAGGFIKEYINKNRGSLFLHKKTNADFQLKKKKKNRRFFFVLPHIFLFFFSINKFQSRCLPLY